MEIIGKGLMNFRYSFDHSVQSPFERPRFDTQLLLE